MNFNSQNQTTANAQNIQPQQQESRVVNTQLIQKLPQLKDKTIESIKKRVQNNQNFIPLEKGFYDFSNYDVRTFNNEEYLVLVFKSQNNEEYTMYPTIFAKQFQEFETGSRLTHSVNGKSMLDTDILANVVNALLPDQNNMPQITGFEVVNTSTRNILEPKFDPDTRDYLGREQKSRQIYDLVFYSGDQVYSVE